MILHRTPLVALLALPNSNMREEKINSGLSCKNRLMYPVVNGISGSLSCIPFSKAQDSGFNKQNWYPGFQNSYSSTWGDKRSHRAKLQMAYCGEKKQNGWKCTKTQPTDLICWDGFCTSLSLNVSDMWDGLPAKYLDASSKPTNYNVYMYF